MLWGVVGVGGHIVLISQTSIFLSCKNSIPYRLVPEVMHKGWVTIVLRIIGCYKIRCCSQAISHSSVQTSHLSSEIYSLNFCCISRCQTRVWLMSSGEFDVVPIEELKVSKRKLSREKAGRPWNAHCVQCLWVVQPLVKLNYHRDLKDCAHWALCCFPSFLPAPINVEGTCVQITVQADSVQWMGRLPVGADPTPVQREWTLLFQSSHTFVSIKSHPHCGFWRKGVGAVCLCVCGLGQKLS
jgi:hypothetical protein